MYKFDIYTQLLSDEHIYRPTHIRTNNCKYAQTHTRTYTRIHKNTEFGTKEAVQRQGLRAPWTKRQPYIMALLHVSAYLYAENTSMRKHTLYSICTSALTCESQLCNSAL